MTDALHTLTWEELCADPSLQDLPYRIELNGLNQIVMSPLHFRHGRYQGKIYNLLSRLLPRGEPSVETAVSTSDNVKVPDVIWADSEFLQRYADAYATPIAPQICIEVLSPVACRAKWSATRLPGRWSVRLCARNSRRASSFEPAGSPQ